MPQSFRCLHQTIWSDCFEHSESFLSKILYKSGITSKMAEFSMRVSSKSLGIVYHVLYSFIRSISCRVINVDWFKLYVKRRHVASVKAYDVLTDHRYFVHLIFLEVVLLRTAHVWDFSCEIYWFFTFLYTYRGLSLNNFIGDWLWDGLIMDRRFAFGSGSGE